LIGSGKRLYIPSLLDS